METKAKYVLVGTFVLLSVLAFFGALLWLGAAQYSSEYAYYQTYFTGSVNGLGKDTIVRYNGIDAGHVSKLQFDPNDPKRVIVTLEVNPDLRLRADSTASIESIGLTGGSYVEISGGSKDAPLLVAKEGQRYPIIPSKPSTLQQLAESTPQLVASLKVVSERFQDVLSSDNRAAFAKTLTNLEVATEQLNRTLQSIDHTTASVNRLAMDTDSVVKNSQDQFAESIVQMRRLVSETRMMVSSVTKLTDDLDREPTQVLFGDRREGYTPK